MKAIFYVIGYEKQGKRGVIVKKTIDKAKKEYDKQIKTPGIIKCVLIEHYTKTQFKIIHEYEQKTIDV